MMISKESDFAIQTGGKESIQDRLKELFAGRTLRKVAMDWGLPYSTLNNYFTKGAKPGLDVVESVCNIENISIEWLVAGKGEKRPSESPPSQTANSLRAAWLLAFEYMNKSDVESLLRIILSGGARGLIRLAQHEADLEETFMLLPTELKERAIELIGAHMDAKKRAPQESGIGETKPPASNKKQAS
jgi:DNA-binding phage protein